MSRQTLLLGISTAVAVVAIGAVLAWKRHGASGDIDLYRDYGAPRVSMPEPNAYDLYVEAVDAVQLQPVDGLLDPKAPQDQKQWPSLYPPEPRADWVKKNQRAWDLVDTALKSGFCLPTSIRDSGLAETKSSPVLKLSSYMLVRKRSLVEQGRISDAIKVGADLIAMGIQTQANNTTLGVDMAFSCEDTGRLAIQEILPQLSAGDARLAIEEVESALAKRAPFAEMYASVAWGYCFQAVRNIKDQAAESPLNPSQQMRNYVALHPSTPSFGSAPWSTIRPSLAPQTVTGNPQSWAANRTEFQLRFNYLRATLFGDTLLTQLALRAWHAEHGSYPSKLNALVPHYLKSVPQDPFGTGELKYRSDGVTFNLWSVGPDARDDNATPLSPDVGTNSVFLDSTGDIVVSSPR